MPEFVLVDRDFAPPRDDARTREYQRLYMRDDSSDPARARSGSAAGNGSSRPAASSGKTFLRALAVLLSVSAIAALFIVAVLPLTEIRGLSVTGAVTVDPAELEAWSGLSGKAYWFSVDVESVRLSLSAHPRLAGVTVERRFPNALAVAVAERAPVAVVYARGRSGRIEAHCVDATGVVFAPASDYPAASGLPVLSGLEIRGLRYGLKLGEPFAGLLASLSDVLGSNPALVSAISEFRIVSKEGAPAELLVYPARYRVPVRMRPVLNAGLLKSMMLVLDVVEGEGLSSAIREIDLRTDTFVYRTKEAVSG